MPKVSYNTKPRGNSQRASAELAYKKKKNKTQNKEKQKKKNHNKTKDNLDERQKLRRPDERAMWVVVCDFLCFV